MANAPIHTIRVGKAKISIWLNEGKDFTTKSYQVTKDYMDKEKNWKSTNSFTIAELHQLLTAVQQALFYHYASKQEAAPTQTQEPAF